MKLLCIKDVVMLQTGEIAFKAGEDYEFTMSPNGEISRPIANGFHYFLTYGPNKWTNHFVHELEGVE